MFIAFYTLLTFDLVLARPLLTFGFVSFGKASDFVCDSLFEFPENRGRRIVGTKLHGVVALGAGAGRGRCS
jgi:hypothetical protein